MKKRGDGGGLRNAKGGDLLRALADALKPKPKSVPPPTPEPSSTNVNLLAAFQRQSPRRTEPGPKPAAAPGKSKKQVLRVPRGLAAALRAQAAQAAPASTGTLPASICGTADLGEDAFRHIAMLRSRLADFRAAHGAGSTLPSAVRQVIDCRIARGAERLPDIIDPEDGYFIGHDFGTSTTKTVLRHPYKTGAAFAVPVPLEWASGGQPHLWPTAIWYDRELELFSATPETGWSCLDGFKSALIEGAGHRTCGGTRVTMREAAAAFLAVHVAYVVGAALEREPDLRIAGINLGVPVAALADDETRIAMENLVRVGLSLVTAAPALTRAEIKAAWCSADPALPYVLHAELTGATAGYCSAPRYRHGGHMIIDCGSATLDMASFTLREPQWPVAIYCARVEPLGADACQAYVINGASVEECRRAARFQEHFVFRATLDHWRAGFAQDERRKYPYQVILIGGGIHSNVHGPLFGRMEDAFHHAFHRPQLARDLVHDRDAEPGRLILADGLARDPIELRNVAMPGDPPPLPPRAHPDGPITKDQV